MRGLVLFEEDADGDELVLLVEVEVEQQVRDPVLCLAVEDLVEMDEVHRVGACSCLYYHEPA